MAMGPNGFDPLRLGGSLIARGKFDWAHCGVMGVSIVQDDGSGTRAAAGLGVPLLGEREKGDPDGEPGEQIWTLSVALQDPARQFATGKKTAMATAVAFVQKLKNGPIEMESWCERIDITA
jgi:hypothetical protein